MILLNQHKNNVKINLKKLGIFGLKYDNCMVEIFEKLKFFYNIFPTFPDRFSETTPGVHSFSAYANFSEKLININFLEILCMQ